MDYLYDSHVNKLIKHGILPQCKLDSISQDTIKTFDFFEKGKDTLVYFQKNPKSLYDTIKTYLTICSAEQLLPPVNIFEAPFNLIINTAYNPAAISDHTPTYQEAIHLCPVVTDLDKALWLIILMHTKVMQIAFGEDKECIEEKFFAWLYLLKIVQNNEYVFGRTLDFSSISDTSPLLEILWSPWNEQNTSAHFVNLTAAELDTANNLECARKELKKRFAEEISHARVVAAETDREWDLFLRILNDYSEKERYAVDRVRDTQLTILEKIAVIESYFSFLQDNANEQYIMDGNAANITPIIEAAKKRLEYAPAHCLVRDDSRQTFRLHPYASELVTFPMTFNLLLLSYHQFRLNPQRNKALFFCNLALHYLKRNLSFVAEDCSYDSIDTLTKEFCEEFGSFADTNRDYIDELSFDDILPDSVFIGNAVLNDTASVVLSNYISGKFTPILAALENADSTNVVQVESAHYSKEDLDAQLAEAQDFSQKEKSKIIAQQVVTSLNIVYLFCDALKIMSDDRNCHSFVDNLDVIDEYREDLQDIHTGIARKVYTKKGELSKHRRETGIDAGALATQEQHTERLQLITFLGIFSKYLSRLNASIREHSIEELLDINRHFRAEILRCPIFIDGEEHIRDLEDFSNKICDSLVAAFETESPEMLKKEKQSIIAALGTESHFLPLSTINTLATAEFLFKRYASPQYQKEGFDYSSISALYYQAFEEAYNSLVWHGYVDRLNSVQIGDRQLVEYLYECKACTNGVISNSSALGYLPEKSYANYLKNGKACVKPTLTYEIFAQLMDNIKKKKLDKLCDYFAELIGYAHRQDMFADEAFMKKVVNFVNRVGNSAKKRNKACHGGTIITFDECTLDKRNVLFDLKKDRENSISLIQLLLHLVKNSKTLPKYNHLG